MASLYSISEDILRIFDEVENAEGEITDEQYDKLCIKQEELNTKLESYVKAVKEFQADAEFCKKEKQSINIKQNVYKNRVERLKKAILNAVMQFGNDGKNNKYIELPTVRIFTKTSKSIQKDENRISIFLREFTSYINELVSQGILYTGEDVDLQGILDCINANCIAENGDSFVPFTISDLTSMKLAITTTSTVYDLFKEHPHALASIADLFDTNVEEVTSNSDLDKSIQSCINNNIPLPTIASVEYNNSIQFR